MRSLVRLLLPALCVIALVPSASPDIGRNGGIVVLPNAVPLPDAGNDIRWRQSFSGTLGFTLQLPDELERAVMFLEVPSSSVGAIAIREGRFVGFDAPTVEDLLTAGVQELTMRFVSAESLAMFVRVVLTASGEVVIEVS